MKNLKNVTIIMIFVSLLSMNAGTSYSQQNPTEACVTADGEPIALGAIFPPPSLFSAKSGESYQGAEAMRQAINECGGVKNHPVEWAYEPASDRANAEEAAQKLIAQGVPLIVGSGLNAVSSAASPIAQESGVVYWEVSEAPSTHGEWIFSLTADSTQLGAAAVDFAQTNFESPRVALVYEKRREQIAEGVKDALAAPPVIEHSYEDEMYYDEVYRLAVEMREAKVNVVILSVFDDDGAYLWYALREADANIDAWIHIGSEGYRRNICRSANSEGFISINPAGPVNQAYRDGQIGDLYERYRATYQKNYGTAPSATADLSASGVYMLLKYVLPSIDGDINAESIRAVAQTLQIDDSAGLMGEGLAFDANGMNQHPSVIARQQQGRAFCSVWPGSIATCSGLLEFPTWRERALAVQNTLSCGGDV